MRDRILFRWTWRWLSRIVFLVLYATVYAQDLELVRTKAIDVFYIGVTSSAISTNNTSIADKLNFGLWRTTTNNHATVYIPTAPEYICHIELFDSNGVAQPKTILGAKIGTKFYDLEPSFSNDTGFKLAPLTAMDEPGWGGRYLFFPRRSGDGNQSMYTPADLFEVKNPGNYMLRIRFQIIINTGSGPKSTLHIVRFPALDYPLVKSAPPTFKFTPLR